MHFCEHKSAHRGFWKRTKSSHNIFTCNEMSYFRPLLCKTICRRKIPERSTATWFIPRLPNLELQAESLIVFVTLRKWNQTNIIFFLVYKIEYRVVSLIVFVTLRKWNVNSPTEVHVSIWGIIETFTLKWTYSYPSQAPPLRAMTKNW